MVHATLEAAVEVFAERGYAGMSFEEVASRAGVNKTTVYRRWPTKVDLLRAAFEHVRADEPPPPDLGALVDDVTECLSRRVAKMSTARGRSVARAIVVGGSDPELGALLAELRRSRPAIPQVVFDRAVARGELAKATDTTFLAEVLLAAVFGRLFWRMERIDRIYLRRMVELILTGARRTNEPLREAHPTPRRMRSRTT